MRMPPAAQWWTAAALPWFMAPQVALAHAFDDRYDLPLPLAYFTTGAALAVALTFVIAIVVVKDVRRAGSAARLVSFGAALPWLAGFARTAVLLVFLAGIAAGFFGTADPMMNLAPTLVWIVGWIGLSVTAILIGDVWSCVDPSRTLCSAIKRLRGPAAPDPDDATAHRWLDRIGAWPSVALLIAWCWAEVVNPQAATPRSVAWLATLWLILNTAALLAFGEKRWRRTGDMFSLYFHILGRFAPFAASRDPHSLALRGYGAGLAQERVASAAMAGLVVAMLSTVLFDGLLSGETWRGVRRLVAMQLRLDPAQATLGLDTAGLVALWIAMFAAYGMTSALAARISGSTTRRIMLEFALTLVPIAAGYHIAHNLTILLVQGQQILPLLSDPLGRQWDLFGTANYRANIGIVDARFTWYVAIGAIVGGHVVSVWLGHRQALQVCTERRRAIAASLPLTVLMVAFTAISLMVIAEPMVKFGIFEENAALPVAAPLPGRG